MLRMVFLKTCLVIWQLFAFFIRGFLASSEEKSYLCGPLSWQPFGDEKCFKLLKLSSHELKTFEEAVKLCKRDCPEATLPTIGSMEEQRFIEKLIQPSTTSNIWIGVKVIESNLTWENPDFKSNFTNWIYNHEIPSGGTHCVELETHRTQRGKWMVTNCTTLNSVLCQKSQSWSSSRLHQSFVRTQKKLAELENKFERRLELLEETQKKLIPVGFVYIQFGNQSEPSKIWPSYHWLDVSSSYSGNFFRVVGGNAGNFGEVQEDSSPRMTLVEFHYENAGGCSGSENTTFSGTTKLKAGFFSGWNYCSVITITRSQGEVRPVNTAIRIWQRTA